MAQLVAPRVVARLEASSGDCGQGQTDAGGEVGSKESYKKTANCCPK